MPTRSKGAFQVQKWYRSHASGYSDGGGRTTQMIIGKRRSGGTRHEKLSGNGDTECASPWQEDGPGVMSLCPFRFFFLLRNCFFFACFSWMGGGGGTEQLRRGGVEKSGRPYEETGASLIAFELARKTTDLTEKCLLPTSL
jgi:hypothetical protein